jgi:hypothetical protein
MPLPKFHSCTWSDDAARKATQPKRQSPPRAGPESLADKELHLWVTYPDAKQKKRRTGNRASSRRKSLKLWAVAIIDEIGRIGAYTYAITLRTIDKKRDRRIRAWVCNDPEDQSDEADVFGLVSPDSRLLSSLEQYLCDRAAQRVYQTISETWPPVQRSNLPNAVSVVPVDGARHSDPTNSSVPV